MVKILEVSALNALEKDEELLKFRFSYDGILMWPFIRWHVLQSALDKMFSLSSPHPQAKNLSIANILKYGFMTIKNNPYKQDAGKRGIVIFSTGIVNIKVQNDGYFNRMYDHFASLYPDNTTIIEDTVGREYLTPRIFKNVIYHDYILAMASAKGRFLPLNRKDESTISNFLVFLRRTFPYDLSDQIWEGARKILSNASWKMVFLHQYYIKLFRKLEPKLLVVEDGCYGSRSYLFKWAKEWGIKTCEMQERKKKKNHPAYNFGDCFLGREFRNYLPEYFLSYGDYWNQQVSLPCDIVTIGNPYLTESVKSKVRDTPQADLCKTVLIISGGTVPELILTIVKKLRSGLDPRSFRIIFRPHPAEVSLCEARYGILKEYDVSFDYGDLYDSLIRSDFLISAEFSTVLFEALTLGIDVYLLRSDLNEYYLGETGLFNFFFDTDHAVDQIKSGSGKKIIDKNNFWDPNWKDNYRNFLIKTIGLS